MLVRCRSNQASSLTAAAREHIGIVSDYVFHNLRPGGEYVVYAMECADGTTLFRVDSTSFAVPAALFDIIDSRVSAHWHVAQHSGRRDVVLLGFPEYVNSLELVTGIIEARPKALAEFAAQCRVMDREFPVPGVAGRALALNDDWVQCSVCMDAWEPEANVAMIDCPKCGTLLHNPLYKPLR